MTTYGQDFGKELAIQRWGKDGAEHLAYECGAKGAEIARLRHALEAVLAYAEDREDADCTGDPPRFIANTWMIVAEICREALR